jgi:poly(hydroxyalkanoate) depolymerase family esterase
MSKLPTRVLEATRLTREGRLREALAVLREPPASRDQPGESQRPTGRAPSVLDTMARSTPSSRSQTARAPADVPGRGITGTLGIGRAVRPHIPPLRNVVERIGQLGSVRGLADGLADLARPAGVQAPPALPDGARFETSAYANAAGRRTYKLYIPGGYAGEPLPLIVMLHGCTQSPDDFAAGTRMNELAEEQLFLVAYPAQDKSANVSKCWNWFNVADQQRDQGEPSLIAGITRQVMRDFAVDPGRVYVAGLSAGGATAAIMGSAYPDLYAAIGVHSGLACGAATDVTSAFAAMRTGAATTGPRAPAGRAVPTLVFHGDRDTTVNVVNGDHVIAQANAAANLRTRVIRTEAPDGIAYTCTVQTDERGTSMLEQWVLHGAGHAWSGGSPAGSHTDPRGPNASREMARFFLQHRKPGPAEV